MDGASLNMSPGGQLGAPDANWISHQTRLRGYDIYDLRTGTALRQDAEKWLIAGLANAMPELKIDPYFAVRRSALSSAHYLTVAVARSGPALIGFLCSRWHAQDEKHVAFLHASICLISQRHRQTLLFRDLWRRHLEQVDEGGSGFPYVIALKTYNPGVYHILSAFTRLDGVTLYPRIDGLQDESTRSLMHAIRDRIAGGLEFDWKSGVIRGAGVPPDFYPELPGHRRRDICEYFRRNLRPEDRLLCVLAFPQRAGIRRRILDMFGAAPSVI
jgi:hypothetical protein